jgi:hypothetical protein
MMGFDKKVKKEIKTLQGASPISAFWPSKLSYSLLNEKRVKTLEKTKERPRLANFILIGRRRN